MNEVKPMKLVILEDEENEIKRFSNSIDTRKELELVGATNSCSEAIKYIQSNDVEGVIVDIELNKGIGGSGLDFLKELNTLELPMKPLIIITTHSESDAVYNAARKLKADMIYCKAKPDYSPNIVLNQFITLRPSLAIRKPKNAPYQKETAAERRKRIEEEINEELNLIGIKHNLKGRKYLFDAILFLIEHGHKPEMYYTNHLKDKYKLRNNSMSTSMQDAINNAWRTTPNEEILEHFTANITYASGAPTPTQFIHYYVDKVKRSI